MKNFGEVEDIAHYSRIPGHLRTPDISQATSSAIHLRKWLLSFNNPETRLTGIHFEKTELTQYTGFGPITPIGTIHVQSIWKALKE